MKHGYQPKEDGEPRGGPPNEGSSGRRDLDLRPRSCRFRLKDEGKAYPRSGCTACNKTITTGLGNSCFITSSDELSRDDLGKDLHDLVPTMLGRAWHEIRLAERIGRIKKGCVGADVASLMAEFAEREVAEATKPK